MLPLEGSGARPVQCLRYAMSGACRGRARRSGVPPRGRRPDAAVGGHPYRAQRHLAHGRGSDRRREPAACRPPAEPRCDRGRLARASWRPVHRQAQHARVCHRRHRHRFGRRSDPEPLGPRAHRGRQQLWLGRRRGRGSGTGGHRHRHRRLDPHTGRLLRCGGPEANLRPGQHSRSHPLCLESGPRRPDRPLGCRHRQDPASHPRSGGLELRRQTAPGRSPDSIPQAAGRDPVRASECSARQRRGARRRSRATSRGRRRAPRRRQDRD